MSTESRGWRQQHRDPDRPVVVVTGASAGVGRATAVEFARRNAAVGLLARGESGLDAAVEDVRRAGGVAVAIPTDVADWAQVNAAADRVEEELGPIDVWVNNASTTVFGRFVDSSAEEFRQATDVTYLGVVHGTRAALDRMLGRNHGTIVQVGSALAYRAIPLQSAYCGAKHAIKGFTESVRTELMHERSAVRITMVQLPALNTPQFDWVLSRLPRRAQPVPPIFQPEVAARAIAYAADYPDRKEYWVGGPTVATLLANRIIPALLDRYLARTGVQSQQAREPEQPDRPHNLWKPLDGRSGSDHGARGRFSGTAKDRSRQANLARLLRDSGRRVRAVLRAG
jgi:short-subunit dehydrogenase